ncbi:hypothetical protein Tco_0226800 [Tanacetum coccineum]
MLRKCKHRPCGKTYGASIVPVGKPLVQVSSRDDTCTKGFSTGTIIALSISIFIVKKPSFHSVVLAISQCNRWLGQMPPVHINLTRSRVRCIASLGPYVDLHSSSISVGIFSLFSLFTSFPCHTYGLLHYTSGIVPWHVVELLSLRGLTVLLNIENSFPSKPPEFETLRDYLNQTLFLSAALAFHPSDIEERYGGNQTPFCSFRFLLNHLQWFIMEDNDPPKLQCFIDLWARLWRGNSSSMCSGFGQQETHVIFQVSDPVLVFFMGSGFRQPEPIGAAASVSLSVLLIQKVDEDSWITFSDVFIIRVEKEGSVVNQGGV